MVKLGLDNRAMRFHTSIFRDPQALLPDFIPPILLFRDAELKQLHSHLLNIQNSPSKYRFIFISGRRRVGKTCIARFFGEAVQRTKSEVMTGYIDCLECNGRLSSILHSLIKRLGGSIPERGYFLEELQASLLRLTKKKNVKLLIILDDLDFLLHNFGLEGWEKLKGVFNALGDSLLASICILSNLDFINKLHPIDQEIIKNRLIRLKPYSAFEIETIIHSRVDLAFKAGSVEEEATKRIVEKVKASNGDLSFAIELLKKSGEVAEENNADKLRLEYVKMAEGIVDRNLSERILRKVGVHEKLLLLSIAKVLSASKKESTSIGEIEREYAYNCELSGLRRRSHTRILHYVKTLSLIGILKVERSGLGYRGRTSLIGIEGLSPKSLEKIVEDQLRMEGVKLTHHTSQ